MAQQGRFDPLDLAALPALPVTAQTFSQIYAAYMADLASRLNAVGIPYNVGSLETDTYAITGEAFSYRTLLVEQSIDDAIKAVLLPTSWGAYLDNLGATQDPPVQRKPLVASPRPFAQYPQDWEADDDFRLRVALAPDALSTCGPSGAYLFFALGVAGTAAAAAYGPMSFGGTIANPFTPLGQVLVPIVATAAASAAGDGFAPASLVAAVQAALRPDDRRPIADFVTVSAATILPYAVNATLLVGASADQGAVLTAALARVRARADLQHSPGGQMLDQYLYADLAVPDSSGQSLVRKVVLNGWADVNGVAPVPGEPGPAFVAPFCPAAAGDPVITTVDDTTTRLVAGSITIQVTAVDD